MYSWSMLVATWAGPLLSIVMLVPIAWRPFADRGVAGLSPTGTIVTALAVQMWLTYGVLVGDPRQISVNVAVWAVRLAILVAVAWSCRSGRMRMLAVGSIAGGLLIAPAGPTAAGFVATTLTCTNRLPQAAHTVRHGRGSGLSVAGFAVGCTADTMWAVYGAVHRDWIVLGSSVLAALLDLAIVVAAVRPEHVAVERVRGWLARPEAVPGLAGYSIAAGE